MNTGGILTHLLTSQPNITPPRSFASKRGLQERMRLYRRVMNWWWGMLGFWEKYLGKNSLCIDQSLELEVSTRGPALGEEAFGELLQRDNEKDLWIFWTLGKRKRHRGRCQDLSLVERNLYGVELGIIEVMVGRAHGRRWMETGRVARSSSVAFDNLLNISVP